MNKECCEKCDGITEEHDIPYCKNTNCVCHAKTKNQYLCCPECARGNECGRDGLCFCHQPIHKKMEASQNLTDAMYNQIKDNATLSAAKPFFTDPTQPTETESKELLQLLQSFAEKIADYCGCDDFETDISIPRFGVEVNKIKSFIRTKKAEWEREAVNEFTQRMILVVEGMHNQNKEIGATELIKILMETLTPNKE